MKNDMPIYVANLLFPYGTSFTTRLDEQTVWKYPDQWIIDWFHRWSLFCIYWPGIGLFALVGKE